MCFEDALSVLRCRVQRNIWVCYCGILECEVLNLIVRGTGVGPGYICVMCSLPYCEGNWCWAWLYLCYVFSTLL